MYAIRCRTTAAPTASGVTTVIAEDDAFAPPALLADPRAVALDDLRGRRTKPSPEAPSAASVLFVAAGASASSKPRFAACARSAAVTVQL